MDKKVEEILKTRAKIVEDWINQGRHRPRGTDFPTRGWRIEFPKDDQMKFIYNQHAYIHFTSIQPGRITSTQVFPARLTGRKKNDSHTSVINNDSDAVLERSYDFSVANTKTFNEDVGVAVEAGLQQKVSYGGAASPVSGETTLSLSVKASYNKSHGGSDTTSRDARTSVECPPRTRLTVTAENSVANYEQEIQVHATVDHEVFIYSHKDCHYKFDSWEDFALVLKGEAAADKVKYWGNDTRNENQRLAERYRENQEWYHLLKRVAVNPTISFKHKTSFSNATVGDIRVSGQPISNE